MTLDMLQKGVKANIVANKAPRQLKARLLALGFIKGNHIEMVSQSLLKSTLAIRLNRREIYSLRYNEAKQIEIVEIADVS